MSKTKITRPSAYAIAMIIRRGQMPDTGAYDTVNSSPSSMYDPYAHVLEYISYWLSISVVFTLKHIMGLSISVSGGSKDRKNGALKVVDFSIFS